MSLTTRDDPLNEVLLPAADIAQRIVSGEKKNARNAERLIAGALVVLLQERTVMLSLFKEEQRLRTHDREYIAALEDVLTPLQRLEVKSYRGLLDSDLRAAQL